MSVYCDFFSACFKLSVFSVHFSVFRGFFWLWLKIIALFIYSHSHDHIIIIALAKVIELFGPYCCAICVKNANAQVAQKFAYMLTLQSG